MCSDSLVVRAQACQVEIKALQRLVLSSNPGNEESIATHAGTDSVRLYGYAQRPYGVSFISLSGLTPNLGRKCNDVDSCP